LVKPKPNHYQTVRFEEIYQLGIWFGGLGQTKNH